MPAFKVTFRAGLQNASVGALPNERQTMDNNGRALIEVSSSFRAKLVRLIQLKHHCSTEGAQ